MQVFMGQLGWSHHLEGNVDRDPNISLNQEASIEVEKKTSR